VCRHLLGSCVRSRNARALSGNWEHGIGGGSLFGFSCNHDWGNAWNMNWIAWRLASQRKTGFLGAD
jgi:hypothetical protein